jgi:hypothetical protein
VERGKPPGEDFFSGPHGAGIKGDGPEKTGMAHLQGNVFEWIGAVGGGFVIFVLSKMGVVGKNFQTE